jgi:hypothetical protein
MTDNPYEAPLVLHEPNDTGRDRRASRPMGVSILAVLHLIGGVILFGVQFLLFANLDAMQEPLRTIGVPPALLIAAVMFLAVLTIASGVGMWKGARWGWWLAAFYYMYSIFRNASALLTLYALSDQLEAGTRSPDYYLLKHSVRIVIHFLLFLYFFKANVLAFFQLQGLNRAKAAGMLVAVCIAIVLATSAVSLVYVGLGE